MACICIIPARGGSTRIPNKNIREFHGKPIIAYSIKTAQEAGIFDAIFVSTDSDEIAEIAAQFGALVHHRDPEMAENEVGTQEVIRDALLGMMWGTTGPELEFVCCLYPTAPLLHHDTLIEAYDILRDGYAEYVVPVATWLRDPGQFYFGEAESFIAGVDLISDRTIMIKTDPARECDINTEEDWIKAEKMYKEITS